MKKSQIGRILKNAKQLIDSESKWTRSAYARDVNDDIIDSSDEKACSWCISGSINKSLGDMKHSKYVDEIYFLLLGTRDERKLTNFNDDNDTTYADVINLLDKGIESANSL